MRPAATPRRFTAPPTDQPDVRKYLATAGLLLVVGAIAAPKVLSLLRRDAPASAVKVAPPPARLAAPLRVEAVRVALSSLAETVTTTGTLRADEGVELQAEANGRIVGIHFQEGRRVQRGDLLVKLNDAELRATLQRTAFRAELAEIKERRLAKLIETKSVNQQDYDVALSELSVQRAEVALVEAQLAKLEIRAPFDGVVGLRFVSEGALVNATTRVATLQRLDRLKIDFALPEKYAGRVRIGGPIGFTAADGVKAQGEIYAVDPRIDVATRTVLVRAACPNPEHRLLPGAFVNVDVVLRQVDDAILVPAVAVVPGLNEKNVFVVSDGKAIRRGVQTGLRTESSVQILAGLQPGEIVITSGTQQLRPGMPVQVAGEFRTGSGGASSAANAGAASQ